MSWGDWLQIVGIILFAVIGASIIIGMIEGFPSNWPDDDSDKHPFFWWF